MDVVSGLEQLIGQLAFPVAVTAYLLIERSKTTKGFTEALNNNTIALTELKTLIRERLQKDVN